MKTANKLINSKSLYLLQHAYNPINWFPWSDEAFDLAQKEDKPIFLSIGYSSCHWCHVMEKESFDNEEIAKILNEHFVSIKVDREEHPDVDNFYMTFVQSTTGSGGWPLSVFLLPDKTPFYGGTYFPPEPRYGRPSFKDVLIAVIEAYNNRRPELEKSKTDIRNYLERIFSTNVSNEQIDLERTKEIFKVIYENYDWQNGGWGSGAKFPMFPLTSFMLDYYIVFKEPNTINLVEHNILKILSSGIYDHIGGGMHRYTVDKNWIVPHYEKMLYDNAQLIQVISKFLIIKENDFARLKLYETFEFLKSEMKTKYGGYITAIDADSEGEEGKFYLWNYQELVNKIEEKFDTKIFFEYFQFNIIEKENLIGNISLRKIPVSNDIILLNELNKIIQHLKILRVRRVKPQKDNKILTDLNSLLISALTYAYRCTKDKNFLNEALEIFEFLTNNLIENNLIYHSFVDGEKNIKGYAEDYFSFIKAMIDLYEITYEEDMLFKARDFLFKALKLFYDSERNIIYQQANSSNLPLRTSENKDYTKPSSTSLAIHTTLKLGKIFENNDWIEIAKSLISRNFDELSKYPFGGGSFFSETLNLIIPPTEFILVEGDDNSKLEEFKTYLFKQLSPSSLIIFKSKHSNLKTTYLNGKNDINQKLTLYVCQNFICRKPVLELSELDLS